tara:strand:+ start:1542 stop:1757 length:216 start_codon:yes stop_codon:yes gene_type:complete
MSEWARSLGISRQALFQRLEKGLPLKIALVPKINIKEKLEVLLQNVLSAKYGTKNRSDLISRIEELKKSIK